MTVAITSIQAYADLKESGGLGRQKRQVISVMHPDVIYSRSELSLLTGLPINCITGRVRELVEEGRLDEAMPRECRITKRLVKTVRLPVAEAG